MGIQNADLEGILGRWQQSSASQKEALYKSYYGFIKGVVKRYVTDYHTTEELVNDSFIKIFTHLHSFKAAGSSANMEQSFKGWVAKIASRTAIDFLRKKKIDLSNSEVNDNILPDPHSSGILKNEVNDILSLLNRLPEIQKTVFNLYEIEGFSHEEIAGMLGISENVCRVYLSRAKNKLKALYIKHF